MNTVIQQIKNLLINIKDLEIRDHIIKEYANNLLSYSIQWIEHSDKEIASLHNRISKIEKEIKKSEIEESLNKHYEQSRRRK